MAQEDVVIVDDEVRSLLHRHGLRMTEQRRLVLQALETIGKPICVPHILEWVREHNPQINRSTIYRTVEALQQLGVISAADLGAGRVQYEISSEDTHHHLICDGCGAEIVADDEPFRQLREHLQTYYGFYPDIHHMGLRGRCRHCISDEE